MGKLPSEVQQFPPEDLVYLMATLVAQSDQQASLIERLANEQKLSPESYAFLAKDLL